MAQWTERLALCILSNAAVCREFIQNTHGTNGSTVWQLRSCIAYCMCEVSRVSCVKILKGLGIHSTLVQEFQELCLKNLEYCHCVKR